MMGALTFNWVLRGMSGDVYGARGWTELPAASPAHRDGVIAAFLIGFFLDATEIICWSCR